MPKVLTVEDCAASGIKFGGRQMDNGEFRFDLKSSDGSAYIRTVMPPGAKGEWQNAHYHGGSLLSVGDAPLKMGTIELILVQSGWVVAADLLPDGAQTLGLYEAGEQWISQPGIPHNIYMPGGAVTHCLKYGVDVGNPEKNGADWYPAPEHFDEWTKSLDAAAIFAKLELSSDKIAQLLSGTSV